MILVIAGALLFAGADLLMTLFILSTADMFLVMAASSDSSPYANMGASREMLQMMAYEPMTLLLAVGFYLATGSFSVSNIIQADVSAVAFMPGLLIGFMFTAAINSENLRLTCQRAIMPIRKWSKVLRQRCRGRRWQ